MKFYGRNIKYETLRLPKNFLSACWSAGFICPPAGRIPSFTEIDALEPFDQQELKISLIDRLLLSKAYESQMFNWWADHLQPKPMSWVRPTRSEWAFCM